MDPQGRTDVAQLGHAVVALGDGAGGHVVAHPVELTERIAALLPRPAEEVDVVVPYDRGDLVNRIHRDGEVLTEEHQATGTRLTARVDGALAAALEEFAAPVG